MLRRATVTALLATLTLPATAAGTTIGDEVARLARGSGSVGIHVSDARTRRTLFGRGSATARPLASLTKLFTADAALELLPRGLGTTVLATLPPEPDGVLRGDVVLKGGGDPTFGSILFNEREYGGRFGTADPLADDLVTAGVRRIEGAVVGDESLFDTARGPAGPFEPELAGALSALAYDRGRDNDFGPIVTDPARAAASVFDDLLEARGVTVRDPPRAGAGPPEAAEAIGEVTTRTASLVRLMLVPSDDFVAEMLGKRFAALRDGVGTTAGAAAILTGRTRGAVTFRDASGLSRENRGSPRHVTQVLRSLDRRGARDLLARPGRGTLCSRRISGRARRACHLKTGTLAGVRNLAGLCRKRGGGVVAFAVLGGRRSVRLADRIATAIGSR